MAQSLLASSLLGESLLASPSSTFAASASSSPSQRPFASPIVASARLTLSVSRPGVSSFAQSSVNSRIQRCSHVAQGIRAVESFDTSFELDPQAREVLVYLLSSDVFLQQVASQPGVPAGITGTEFTGELFPPVPWSPTTRFGMPQELEKYNEDKENYIIINVPPNFMFKAQIFKPSRLCAIFKVLRDQPTATGQEDAGEASS
ncbi:hypothetical protein CLOM_g15434 [Closterium sp. NIES-68]|nr:hypothetical protein CLOM_g15434 [Closterium sp. NIES-68]GJP67701.1 hypothetical protein CLOP_g24490 [Closterium sp. NIES-67]